MKFTFGLLTGVILTCLAVLYATACDCFEEIEELT